MRYLPLNDDDRQAMLARIGVETIDDLFVDVPQAARREGFIDLPLRSPESDVERHLRRLSAKNTVAGDVPFFLGGGAYRHHVPATVDYVIQRGEFLTAYTPYQPEIAQGTLQTLFEFQTQVARLTGMDVANASMYDGSTGCAEAVFMARRVTRRNRAVLSSGLHPHYRDVVMTMTHFTDDEVLVGDPERGEAGAPGHDLDALIASIDDKTSCVVVQNPNVFGHIADLTPVAEAAHAHGALLIVVVTEAISFGAIKSPGAKGADIVVAEGQSIGGGLTFGGPYVGLFATRQKYVRQMPGRLVGETTDADGERGFVLTLSTREQHIRREKATSNICTNSGLCALAFTAHMTLLGEKGITQLAKLNHMKAVRVAEQLDELPGVELLTNRFFNEFTVRLSRPAAPFIEDLARRDILAGIPLSRLYPNNSGLENDLLVAVTETVSTDDIDALVRAFEETFA
ncbi:MAG: aminomethyl-transferring glycine dehydrogenase subunit GcvPA [Pseudomonadota bacterium]